MSISLQLLYTAHLEWLGVRKSLTGQEKRHFHRWVCRVYPELFTPFRDQPALFRQQCLEVHRGSSPPSTRGVSLAVLKRYAEALAKHYLSLPEASRLSYAAFLDDVVVQCPNEDALKRFLGLPPT